MRIVIGQGSCGIAAGAEKVRRALSDKKNERQMKKAHSPF